MLTGCKLLHAPSEIRIRPSSLDVSGTDTQLVNRLAGEPARSRVVTTSHPSWPFLARGVRLKRASPTSILSRLHHRHRSLLFSSFWYLPPSWISLQFGSGWSERGCTPDATVGTKPIAVCYAAINGDSCLMSYLLSNGSSVDSEDGMGMTPLHYEAMGGDPTCVSMLVAHGARLNRKDRQGKTPLTISKSRLSTSESNDLLERYGARLSESPPGPKMFH